MKGRIRVIAVPAGEAPPWVREKWVGLELPLTLLTRGRHFLLREEECRPIDDAVRR